MARKMDLRAWTEGTAVATMVMALSFLPIEFVNSGLDLSLGMVLLVLYSFRRGLLSGVAVGLVWDILNIILGTAVKNFSSVPQIIFEYPPAFAFGRMGGVFARKIQLYSQANCLKPAVRTIILGSAVAVFARWSRHLWADVLARDMYASEGMGPYLYSFVLDGTSTVANCLYASLVLGSSARAAPQLFIPKK